MCDRIIRIITVTSSITCRLKETTMHAIASRCKRYRECYVVMCSTLSVTHGIPTVSISYCNPKDWSCSTSRVIYAERCDTRGMVYRRFKIIFIVSQHDTKIYGEAGRIESDREIYLTGPPSIIGR